MRGSQRFWEAECFLGEKELRAMWLRLSATMLTIKVSCMMMV
jgi:hypothetical protein